jgi:hypothetical protein
VPCWSCRAKIVRAGLVALRRGIRDRFPQRQSVQRARELPQNLAESARRMAH